MPPNPKTTPKPITVPPHISINNGLMGTFHVPILCTCTVGRHMSLWTKDLFILGAAVPGEASKTMVELFFWPSIVLIHKLAIYCNYIWYILRTTDFYVLVWMCDCCLQGIQPCKWKGNGHQWLGNQVFRWLGLTKETKEWDLWKRSPKPFGKFKNRNSLQDDKY